MGHKNMLIRASKKAFGHANTYGTQAVRIIVQSLLDDGGIDDDFEFPRVEHKMFLEDLTEIANG